MHSPGGSAAERQQRQTGSLQRWLHARARLAPNLLSQAPSWVRAIFDHAWAPMTALVRQASCLPAAMCQQLLEFDTGFLVISAGASHYAADSVVVRGQHLQNVAFVSVEDLATGNEQVLHVIGHLVDHHLGCAGQPCSPWLSEGGGATQRWREAGERLPQLFALGYGVDNVARANVRDYFAQSLAVYCQDRRRLNVADPIIHKWFRATLWQEAFWEGQR
jgi:hypothetical protein